MVQRQPRGTQCLLAIAHFDSEDSAFPSCGTCRGAETVQRKRHQTAMQAPATVAEHALKKFTVMGDRISLRRPSKHKLCRPLLLDPCHGPISEYRVVFESWS